MNGLVPGRSRSSLLARLAQGSALAATIAALACATPALAAVPVYNVGDTILNPVTGMNEIVVEVIGTAAVRTNGGYAIITATTVGDTFVQGGVTYKVTAVTTSVVNGTNQVTGVTLQNQTTMTFQNAMVYTSLGGVPAAPGTGGTTLPFTAPPGNVNVIKVDKVGNSGDDGSDGGGIGVGPFTIGVDADAGAAGAPGPTNPLTVAPITIQSITDGLAGIKLSSIGGNGGDGGNTFGVGSLKAGGGGPGGPGGLVDLTVQSGVIITTSGVNAYGIQALSQSGRGGNGGDSYTLGNGDGGTGGGAGMGGEVRVTSFATLSTGADGSTGIFAQSLGGAGGTGGNGYGIVGQPGQGLVGGNGGLVTVAQGGTIQTAGRNAYGVLAESIGGSGGTVGSAVGIVSLGDSAGVGGNGGDVTLRALGGSSTVTTGDGSTGLFAQSVGGGGGAADFSVGLVSLGSKGAAGGSAGTVTTIVEGGAVVTTGGPNAAGVFAQSVGGGGGKGALSAGAVSVRFGAGSGSGGDGGVVTIDSSGLIKTTGANSNGLFAQSIGGGGGAAGSTFGVVALGSDGTGGGNSRDVAIFARPGGSVITNGDGSVGLYAQSVGGGGGAGALTGGVISLGSSGGGGGTAGAVRIENGGLVQTTGQLSLGLFAQSVGGGGGSGGFLAGLAAIGGNGGGSAGDGNAVTVINTGTIKTGGGQATALTAQSVGGGGGNGGTTGSAFLTIGSTGGDGGKGGPVMVTHQGDITTGGADSDGINAQAVGGGGGKGGAAATLGIFAGFTLGGTGGGGGAGGTATLTLNAVPVAVPGGGTVLSNPSITTNGDRSRGVFIQSVGGGGGDAGFAANLSLGIGYSASLAVGGSGGDGGQGGTVTSTGGASILTTGANAQGFEAQSVGGGGGNGAFGAAAALSGGAAAASFAVGIGGRGGGGGDGGLVDVRSGGSIMTSGVFATGFQAQSVGGGGGNGGFSIAGTVNIGLIAAGAQLGVGGSGAKGGDGGQVTGLFDGVISTTGSDAAGAVVQSIGGGGGKGGFNVSGGLTLSAYGGLTAGVGFGGSGAGGGVGGTVFGRTGTTTTAGDRSAAVLFQSVGGGGGSGGFNVAAGVNVSILAGASIAVGFGGSGGGGGVGGQVTGTAGTTTTKGSLSDAVTAQSLGGGGGAGGFDVAGGIDIGGLAGGSMTIGFGGAGAGGGNGGAVDLTVNGATETGMAAPGVTKSSGIIAQSVGGGGGAGGFEAGGGISGSLLFGGGFSLGMGGSGAGGGNGGAVLLRVNGDTRTGGSQSRGVTAQSVGGGGGAGGLSGGGTLNLNLVASGSVSYGAGGAGGGGGDGGTVDTTVIGNVATLGTASDGVTAQSIGGGGGAGGFNITGALAGGVAGGSFAIGVGGSGGLGGDGSLVKLAVLGDTTTALADSRGIIAQSVGGGGGSGGFDVTGSIGAGLKGSLGVGIGTGGAGGSGGSGGEVRAQISGDTGTGGARSDAVTAQSIGGGGGAAGFNVGGAITASGLGTGAVGVGVGGHGGDGGDAGLVTLVMTGHTTTTGPQSAGGTAQSVGGGGGTGGFNVGAGLSLAADAGVVSLGFGGSGGGGGNGGAVTMLVTGDTRTGGAQSAGLNAQSVGGGGGAGGMSITGAVALSTGINAAISLGVGGSGGGGGSGGAVTLFSLGKVDTLGSDATGVFAQSLGGGGGNGGITITGGLSVTTGSNNSVFTLGVGGSGGAAGNAGDVFALVTGDVTAAGNPLTALVSRGADLPGFRLGAGGSNGVIAQSVGGGGGTGGLNISAGIAVDTSFSSAKTVNIGVGGYGGAGGQAGAVTLTLGNATATPVIVANGDARSAVIAQSIGGGGGDGGINISGGIAFDGAVVTGVGGRGGIGGRGGTVDVTSNADLYAAGDFSRGLFAQSVGGGGGSGGINISGAITANKSASLPTIAYGLGGAGGPGSTSGDVDVDAVGRIAVEGSGAVGLLAQSVAGGGGSGGLNVTAAFSLSSKPNGYALGVGIGGSGAAGSDAGDVRVTSSGLITVNQVTGADSVVDSIAKGAAGLVVQSIGGGGGVGGINATGVVALSGSPTSIAVGGSGGSGGNGGTVMVLRGYANGATGLIAAPDEILTYGVGADGISAQSVGGGGGRAGINASLVGAIADTPGGTSATLVTVGGNGAGAGSGDMVTVLHNGSIKTDGGSGDGINAQSIGGGGGNANFNIAVGVVKDLVATGTAVGGSPGAGGTGGKVTVVHMGSIQTAGDNAVGISAQSIGGGGGNTSTDLVLTLLASTAMKSTLGRMGGPGGAGGAVVVDVLGDVTTGGANAAGVIAQSIGGGGGLSSANSISTGVTDLSAPDKGQAQTSLSVGIDGGIAAVGGSVSVVNDGKIATTGIGSAGVMAQSVGGGGGIGGTASSVVFRAATADSLNIGGMGGAGAAGGTVTVDNFGLITTGADRSDGIYAQSVGGGGGMGGAIRALSVQIGGAPGVPTTSNSTINLGASGGTGGTGGAVTVTNYNLVTTAGVNAYGIRAQSVGGGGGRGDYILTGGLQGPQNNVTTTLNIGGGAGGGSGGTGGIGGTVTVDNRGVIMTAGAGAYGIGASSIGGGGGDGSAVYDVLLGYVGTGNQTQKVATDIGGKGGTGGKGGVVLVTNEASGLIATTGDRAYGIFAQSVGGGGGNGGIVLNATALVTGPASFSTSTVMGGSGGNGGDAGAVTVTNRGAITTTGMGAYAIYAQSVGGGGGNAAVAYGGSLLFGATLFTPAITLGGTNGSAGRNGDVVVINTGQLFTTGVGADAFSVQVVNGGGGTSLIALGGDGSTAQARTAVPAGQRGTLVTEKLLAVPGDAVAVTLGASGGVFDAGNTVAQLTGGVTTTADGAFGLFAQSIGAGGGQTRLFGADPGVLTFGGTAGARGDGGSIDLTNNGAILTQGTRSYGVFLQSVGGGGGAVFAPLSSYGAESIALRAGNTGNGGLIVFRQTGDIVVDGADGYGVIAQSLGGGGGWADGGFAGAAGGAGKAGAISLTLNGSVLASNTNGVGVFAQSQSTGGRGAITVYTTGAVRGGTGTGAGIRLDGGAANLVTIAGSLSAVSGLAITGTDGDDTVDNSGMVAGNVRLGSGDNRFNNKLGATFIAFSEINLRASPAAIGRFNNDGRFLMGLSATERPIDLDAGEQFANTDANGDPRTNFLYGSRVINSVALSGDYNQSSTGYLAFDIAYGPYASDQVKTAGNATVAGTGDITLTWLENAKPVLLFATTGGVGVNNGLEISDTIAIDYSVSGGPTGIALSFVSDFGKPFLNWNEASIGRHMDSAILLGDSHGIGRLAAWLGNLRPGEEALYSYIFEQLNPEAYVQPAKLQYYSAQRFTRDLFGCAGPLTPQLKTCTWGTIDASWMRQPGTFQNFRTTGSSQRIALGFDTELSGDWRLVGAAGYTRTAGIKVAGPPARLSADGFNLGVGFRYMTKSRIEIDGALSGGNQWAKGTRQTNIFEPLTGSANPDSDYIQASLAANTIYSGRRWYLRPQVAWSVTGLRLHQFSERGIPGIGVESLGRRQYLGTFDMDLFAGVDLFANAKTRVALEVDGGGTFQLSERIAMPFRLLGSNPAAIPARIGVPLNTNGYRLSARLKVASGDWFDVSAGYSFTGGGADSSDNANFRINYRF